MAVVDASSDDNFDDVANQTCIYNNNSRLFRSFDWGWNFGVVWAKFEKIFYNLLHWGNLLQRRLKMVHFL